MALDRFAFIQLGVVELDAQWKELLDSGLFVYLGEAVESTIVFSLATQVVCRLCLR